MTTSTDTIDRATLTPAGAFERSAGWTTAPFAFVVRGAFWSVLAAIYATVGTPSFASNRPTADSLHVVHYPHCDISNTETLTSHHTVVPSLVVNAQYVMASLPVQHDDAHAVEMLHSVGSAVHVSDKGGYGDRTIQANDRRGQSNVNAIKGLHRQGTKVRRNSGRNGVAADSVAVDLGAIQWLTPLQVRTLSSYHGTQSVIDADALYQLAAMLPMLSQQACQRSYPSVSLVACTPPMMVAITEWVLSTQRARLKGSVR